jgi:hypothetical protein
MFTLRLSPESFLALYFHGNGHIQFAEYCELLSYSEELAAQGIYSSLTMP